MSLTSSHSAALAAPDTDSARGVLRRAVNNPWVWAWIALPLLSYLILRWAQTSPGYDPYGWLDWGYQALRGHLNLHGAPSWKPVTFIFTLPYSIFGHYSWWLWRITALSFAIVGPVTGGRIAYRLVRREDEPVWPALIAALFAGIGIVMIVQYWHYILSSQSDPMLVSFVLLGFDALLSRRWRLTLFCLFIAGLGRPEVWALMGLYWLWCWFKVPVPGIRRWLIAALIITPFLWFGIPVITGAYWDIAGRLAQHSVRELHSNKFTGTLTRFFDLTYWPVLVSAAVTFLWSLLRRDWWVAGVGAVAIIWMGVEEWFVLSNGFPGVARYMFEAGAFTIVLGGIGVGWLARIAFGSTAALWGRGAVSGGGGRLPARLGAGVLALVLVAFMAPYAKSAWDWEHVDIVGQRARTHSIYMLDRTIARAGGAAFVRSCGVPTVDVGAASILAWDTHLNTAQVGYIPVRQIRMGGPVVLFTGLFNGWVMHTYNEHGAAVSRCRVLNDAYYLETAGHPTGEFFHLNH